MLPKIKAYNLLFEKIICFLSVLIFGAVSLYYLFHIYAYDRGSRSFHYLLIAFFLSLFLFLIYKSARNIFKNDVLVGKKQLIIAILLFCAAVILKFTHLNRLFGINFNLSLNYPVFLTISSIWLVSILIVFFAMIKNPTRSRFNEKRLLFLVIAVATLFFFFLTSLLYMKFSTYAYDLGIFDQVVWKYSQFKTPYDTIVGIHDLADHFEPILFFVGLTYKIWSSVYTLLLVEAFIVAAGFYPIYKLGQKYIKDQFCAIYIGLGYLLSLGIVQAIHYPVHPGTWLPTFYAFAIYYLDSKKYLFYFLFVILALLTKESAFIHILFIGIFSIVYFREKIIGFVTILLSVVAYLLIFKYVMPHFNYGLPYVHGIFDNISNDPKEFLKFVFMHPIDTLKIAFDNLIKSQTLFLTLGTVGFVPIFSIGAVLLIMPFFAERLLTNHPNMMTMGFHYSAPITAIVFIVAIFAIGKFKSTQLRYALSIFVFMSSFTLMFSNYFYKSPLDSYMSLNTYQFSDREKLANDVLKSIPRNASVTAEDAFVTHLSHRDNIRLYNGNIFDSDYVILGKSPDYSSWPISFEVVNSGIDNLRLNINYFIVKENQRVILFQKVAR